MRIQIENKLLSTGVRAIRKAGTAGLLLLLLSSWGCASEKKPGMSPAAAEAATLVAAPVPAAPSSNPVTAPAAPTIDAKRAFQYAKEITAFGPRPVGSANHKKLEGYITSHLKGDQVEDDSFTADTPEGKFPIRNIIAKYPGTKDGIIVILGHYDTVYPLRDKGFVGANDGGSSTAILLEFANQLRGKKRDGYSVWLVWTDGEEAIKHWTDTDSVYGARHLAEKWRADGTLPKIKALFVADMIGDADLDIQRDQNSAPWLEDLVLQSATHLGYQSHFFAVTTAIEDDHIPFVRLGVPCADIIDLDYGYGGVFWHTAQDTMDKLSPKSLEIAGNVILQTIWMVDQK